MVNVHTGDAFEILIGFPDNSINCCITSPPYYALRDYGHSQQIGLEDTPEEYIHRLVHVFRGVRRVLRDDGTLWVNIGDSYAGSGKGAVTHPKNATLYKQGTNKGSFGGLPSTKTKSGCKPKDLIGIPWMLAFALREDGWYLRQDIIWSKPNPMPESVTDRCTKSKEYIFLLSKSPKYYFDAAAIAEPVSESTKVRLDQNVEKQNGSDRVPGKTNGAMKACAPRYGGRKYTANPDVFSRTKSGNAYDYRPMRNKRDVWTVATSAFSEAHFATFPPELIRPCILAGCPEGGTVLDPFCGSGTTGVVCNEMGRHAELIDIKPEYAEMTRRRTAQVSLIDVIGR